MARILRHACWLGASTRAAAQLAEQMFGRSASHETVSRLTRCLDGQLAAWRDQRMQPVYQDWQEQMARCAAACKQVKWIEAPRRQ